MSLIKKLFKGTFIDPDVREQKRQQQEELEKIREQEELKKKRKQIEIKKRKEQEKQEKQEYEQKLLSLEITKYLTTVNPEFILEPIVQNALKQAFIGRCRGLSVDITLPDDIYPIFEDFFNNEFIVFVLMLEKKGFNFKYKEEQFVYLMVREYSLLNYYILSEKYKMDLEVAKSEDEVLSKLIDLVGFDMILDIKYLDFLSVYLFKNKFTSPRLTLDEIIWLVDHVKEKYKVKKLEERISNIGTQTNNVDINIQFVDSLTGIEFEEFISRLLDKMGYTCKLTKKSGDQGVDILAFKNGVVTAVQTKRYDSAVGNSAIQEVVSGMQYYNAYNSKVITNNYFTPSAKALAQKTGTFLWDRDILNEMINLYFSNKDYLIK